MSQTYFAGYFRAYNFAFGIIPSVGALRVDQNTQTPAGGTTITVPQAYFSTDDAVYVAQPVATTASLTIGSGASQETFTPSSVSYSGTQATITYATGFTYAHGEGDIIASGTIGLQEAINYASGQGGGIVVVDSKWAAAGGTTAMIAAATLPSSGKVVIQDNRGGSGSLVTSTILVPNANVLTMYTTPYQLLPAPGAGNAYIVNAMTVENVYSTGAFTGGGAIQASYGTVLTYPATATIAATFLTSPTANQIISVSGALASNLSSNILNKGIYLSNATAVFAAGAGSLIVKLQYALETGF